MKAKDMPSVRARDFANVSYQAMMFPPNHLKIDGKEIKAHIVAAYMAGYRHGRKMKDKL